MYDRQVKNAWNVRKKSKKLIKTKEIDGKQAYL